MSVLERHESEPLLIISYDWPPMVAGVRRWVKFAHYLPEFDYRPLVVCARPTRFGAHDEEPLHGEVSGVSALMTSSYDPYHAAQQFSRLMGRRGKSAVGASVGADDVEAVSGFRSFARRAARQCLNFCLFPDDRVGWVGPATRAAAKLIERHHIRKIVTTSYPHSAHLVGLRLKRKFPDLYWLADFRDGWVQNPYFRNAPTPLHRYLHRRLEAKVVIKADAVVTVCEPIARHLSAVACNSKPVHVISNGYDSRDYASPVGAPFDKLTLVYTGTLFMQRSPDEFFRALSDVVRTVNRVEDRLQVIFMRKFLPEHYESVHPYGLDNIVRVAPMGSHRAALELQRRADGLLAIEGRAAGAEIMLTQKIFEYMAARRPVLAIAPEGALADAVRASGCGVVVAPEDYEGLCEALRLLLAADGSFPFELNEAYIAQFDRQFLTRRLARLLDMNDLYDYRKEK